MDEQTLQIMREEIAKGIQLNVNGKIDKMQRGLDEHNTAHEKDMQRMMPIIEAFERGQGDLAAATRGGKFVLAVAAVITALGGAYLIFRAIFFNH